MLLGIDCNSRLVYDGMARLVTGASGGVGVGLGPSFENNFAVEGKTQGACCWNKSYSAASYWDCYFSFDFAVARNRTLKMY